MSGRGRCGAQPYQMENECSVSSSLHNRSSGGASTSAGASLQVQSTAYRWPSGLWVACALLVTVRAAREQATHQPASSGDAEASAPPPKFLSWSSVIRCNGYATSRMSCS